MTKPTRVIPAKAGTQAWGTTKWGASGQSSKARPSREMMTGRDILVLAFATIAIRILKSYRGLC
jgi:hypothetical protein